MLNPEHDVSEANTESRDAGAQALTEALQTSFRLLRWLVLAVLLAYLGSGLFVVRQHERAFVLRLGRIDGLGADRVKGPGLHWTWPRPLARVLRVPAERVQTVTSTTFWHDPEPEFQEDAARPAGPTLNPERAGYLLTGDANILHARWALRYTVSDPERWLFAHTDPEQLVRQELDAAILRETSRQPIDRALRSDVAGLRDAVEHTLVERLRARDLGVRVQGLDVLALAPPLQVAEAFDAVIKAEQSRAQQISEARATAARTRNAAAGEASRLRSEGQTYRSRLLADIAADTNQFAQLLPRYERNPAVFKQTLLQETVRRTLANVEQKFIVQGGTADQEWRLQLGPEGRRAMNPNAE